MYEQVSKAGMSYSMQYFKTDGNASKGVTEMGPLVESLSWHPSIPVKWLLLMWRLGTSRWNLLVPILQMSRSNLIKLERLRSEDTPRRSMITLTIDQFILNPKSILLISSYRIPSQKKVKAEKIRKICEKI